MRKHLKFLTLVLGCTFSLLGVEPLEENISIFPCNPEDKAKINLLGLKDTNLPNLDILYEYPNLIGLKLIRCTLPIEEYETITSLKDLEALNLDMSNVSVTAFLRSLTKLTILSLQADYRITTLNDILTLTRLTHLNLSACYGIMTELPRLEVLTELEVLKLNGIFVDLDRIAEFPSLEFLVRFPHLKKLFLNSNTYLQNIEPVKRIPSLEFLDIKYCESLTGLDSFFLKSNVIVERDPIISDQKEHHDSV